MYDIPDTSVFHTAFSAEPGLHVATDLQVQGDQSLRTPLKHVSASAATVLRPCFALWPLGLDFGVRSLELDVAAV